MARARTRARQIALFVEGETEQVLPAFFHKWLDPQVRDKVGIRAVKFQGVSEYLDDLPTKLGLYLDECRADYVVGLVDLYGLPFSRIDPSGCVTIKERVSKARGKIRKLIPSDYEPRFHQHFAVHEVEAWLLAYPERWPSEVRDQITRRPPEQVNFDEPPAKFLKRILGGKYKKTVRARNIFPRVDPQTAIDKCPFLKLLADDLLRIARQLQ